MSPSPKTATFILLRSTLCAALLCPLGGCAVVAVADAVVTTGAVIVKTGVKAVGAVADAVIPDSSDKK